MGQRQALGYLAVRLFATGFGLALVFFAVFCALTGVLILRSRLMPRVIGAKVLGPDLTRRFPRLRMVNWFEWRKYEPEVHAVVDWTVTRDPAQRTAFRAQLPYWLRYADAVDFCRH